jgi:hypothetical protein
MDQACQTFRTDWLERALEAGVKPQRGAHLDGCADCRSWIAGAQAQIAAMGRLDRRAAPAELEVRLFAPRADAESAAEELWARRLGDLEPLCAPAVLDRLVDEELRAPSAARARRFAGDLGRQAAPTLLERRVHFALRRREAPHGRRLRLAVAASVAAALLALGVGLLREPERPFIVHRGRPARSQTLVAELAGGWTGSILRPDGLAAEEGK